MACWATCFSSGVGGGGGGYIGDRIQLINAFEKPVASKNGIADASVTALKAHHEQLKTTWSIKPVVEVAIPDTGLETFCERLVSHVG